VTLHVFGGPSLHGCHEIALQRDDVRISPPVRLGDLDDLRDDYEAPGRVLVLDGEFGQSFSLPHAELQRAVHGGWTVFGASSMGALRAAEAHAHGVVPIGWVAFAYLTGRITSDAEVAVIHDTELFEPHTVPLVNVRWLLERRLRDGAITSNTAEEALVRARGLHFRARTPSGLRRAWADLDRLLLVALDDDERPKWDRKHLDAHEALRLLTGHDVPCPRSDALVSADGST
jgi:TfuA protein